MTQTDNPIETFLDKFDGKHDSEHVPTKSPEKSEEKYDSDSMFVICLTKKKNYGEKKDQSTNIVNINDPGL